MWHSETELDQSGKNVAEAIWNTYKIYRSKKFTKDSFKDENKLIKHEKILNEQVTLNCFHFNWIEILAV